MKKLLLIFAIVLCVSASVFADGFVGVETGPGISWFHQSVEVMNIEVFDADASSVDYFLGLTGAHYFNGSVGLGYGIALDWPLLEKVEDSDYEDVEDSEPSFIGILSFQYKNDLSTNLAVEAGLGMYVTHDSEKETVVFANNSIAPMEMSLWQFGLLGNIGVAFEPVQSFAIRAGLRVYSPLFTTIDVEVSGIDIDAEVRTYGIAFIPYIGLAYAY